MTCTEIQLEVGLTRAIGTHFGMGFLLLSFGSSIPKIGL